jgi:hypothetical protein
MSDVRVVTTTGTERVHDGVIEKFGTRLRGQAGDLLQVLRGTGSACILLEDPSPQRANVRRR